ncbi:thioredoxin domain-containing protein [Pontixanthobacter luteolus]|uniref:thioredoxin domain-containing protein n=1 Tax=Pontixanthobacter luteolus TaxID=295089 RepID=UPI0023037342|nr:thioredoxin domain-containing protein [Pontixanthobacter luteolus]
MTTTTFRKLAFATLAAPLTLGLAGCDSAPEGGAATSEPIAPIEAPAGQQWTDIVNVSESDGYILGNPDAPIKVIEYASLTCPACAAFAANGAEQLKSEYVSTGRVSFELRNQIHGPHDLALATMVRCGAKESFHPLSDQVWTNLQQVLQPIFDNAEAVEQSLTLPEDQRLVQLAEIGGFYDFFAARGLSTDQARQCLADADKYKQIAENSTTQSNELDVTGTPTFFINGRKLDANSWTQIEPELQRAGAR